MLTWWEKIKQFRWKDFQSLLVKEDEMKIEMTGNRMCTGRQNENQEETGRTRFEMAVSSPKG